MSQPPYPPTGGSPQQPGEWPPPPGGTGDWQSDPTQQLPSQPQYPPTQPLPTQPPGGQWPGESWPTQSPQGSPGQPWPGQPAPTQPLPAQEQPYGQQPYGQAAYGQAPYGQGSAQSGPGPSGAGGSPEQGPAGYGSGGYGPGYVAPGAGGPGAAGAAASGQYGAPGGYGPAGGQGYGPPGQYGPPGGSFGAPPSGGGGMGAPPGGGRGRNPMPLILGIVAGVVAIGLLGWYFFLRPSGTAAPSPSAPYPTQSAVDPTPTVLAPSGAPSVEPSSSGDPSPQPSASASAQCSAELTKLQCDWAVYLRKYVQIDTCRPDDSDVRREAFLCTANARGKLRGEASVALRWADDPKDLTGLMDDFFRRAGIAKSAIGSNWKKPPAHTNWWYTETPKKIEGKLGSANAKDGTGRVAWTFSKQRFFIEAVSDGDDVDVMIDWWART